MEAFDQLLAFNQTLLDAPSRGESSGTDRGGGPAGRRGRGRGRVSGRGRARAIAQPAPIDDSGESGAEEIPENEDRVAMFEAAPFPGYCCHCRTPSRSHYPPCL